MLICLKLHLKHMEKINENSFLEKKHVLTIKKNFFNYTYIIFQAMHSEIFIAILLMS